jgi:hypothetical protein
MIAVVCRFWQAPGELIFRQSEISRATSAIRPFTRNVSAPAREHSCIKPRRIVGRLVKRGDALVLKAEGVKVDPEAIAQAVREERGILDRMTG